MEERELNQSESLELITQMIRNTQQRFEKENVLPFLVFGYITVAISAAVWYLLQTTGNYRWNLLWFLIPILGFPLLKLLGRTRHAVVRTYIDRAVNYIWIVCAATVLVASVLAFFINVPIFFIVALLMGIATTLTGLVTNMRFIAISGSIGLALSFVILLFAFKGVSILIFGAIFLVMMVIPGHILYCKGKK